MAKKKKQNKNPLLQQKHAEGKWEGIQQATAYFMEKFEQLKKEPGIGPKTAEKIERIMFQPNNKK